jgi:hypothetical protein
MTKFPIVAGLASPVCGVLEMANLAPLLSQKGYRALRTKDFIARYKILSALLK